MNESYRLALEAGAQNNGRPGVRAQMSRQPYYAAYVIDPDGNNLEVVNVDKSGVKAENS